MLHRRRPGRGLIVAVVAAVAVPTAILTTSDHDGSAATAKARTSATTAETLARTAPTGIGVTTTSSWEFVVSADGRTLVTAVDNAVQSWNVTDPAKPTPVSQTLPSSGNWLTFSPDGHTLRTGENGQKIRIWDLH